MIYILDVNGYFISAVSATIEGEKILIVHNTTSGSYLAGNCVPAAFDFVFPAF